MVDWNLKYHRTYWLFSIYQMLGMKLNFHYGTFFFNKTEILLLA